VSRAAPGGFGGGTATVDTFNAAGMPCTGSQYARVIANGPITVQPGGPLPVNPGLASQIFIPVPTGALTVSLCWDFYLTDFRSTASFNDGMGIDFIGTCGGNTLGSPLVYADTTSPVIGPADTGSPCASGGSEVIPLGAPQALVAAVPAGAAFLRVSVWNGGDNTIPSHGVVDNVTFTTGVAPCALSFTSPAGPGSVRMDNTGCVASAGRPYFSVVDLTAGAYPAGWFFGLDVGLPELLSLFSFGPPFTGTLDASGASTTGVIGPFPALSGLTLYGVTTEWTPGFAALLGARQAVSYAIP
jgi:hypothetical protein